MMQLSMMADTRIKMDDGPDLSGCRTRFAAESVEGETLDILFSGTGTSTGVPMIGCDCPVCRSTDRRNRRRRSSLYIQAGKTGILIDTPPDFREQALEYKIPRIDAVLFTHAHADHIFGLDDLRRYNTMQNGCIAAYGVPETLKAIRRAFGYVDAGVPVGLFRPRVDFQVVNSPFEFNDVAIHPYDVEHGNDRTVGYRLTWRGFSVGYAPDCNRMDNATIDGFRGVDIMILDALRHRPHKTHFTITESLEVLRRIGAPNSFMTHLSHDVDHAVEQARLPSGMKLAWDGLRLRFSPRAPVEGRGMSPQCMKGPE